MATIVNFPQSEMIHTIPDNAWFSIEAHHGNVYQKLPSNPDDSGGFIRANRYTAGFDAEPDNITLRVDQLARILPDPIITTTITFPEGT